jgi:hypothetical protein
MTLVILFPRVFVYGAYVCQPKGTYRSDWRGESRETLLKRPDVLGLEVRRRPRAYLVLPEITARKRNNQAVRSFGGAAIRSPHDGRPTNVWTAR